MDDSPLIDLERTLHREMPICVPMAIRPVAWDGRQLSVEMPLEPNRNHQYSAFAGSLNALCTIAGWGAIFLLLRREKLSGNIVIRRSQIRYFRPVRSANIVAQSLPLSADAEAYFFELLRSMGQSKVDIESTIADAEGPLVNFSGSYVILG
jgi:thioesterase domain-containing protein